MLGPKPAKSLIRLIYCEDKNPPVLFQERTRPFEELVTSFQISLGQNQQACVKVADERHVLGARKIEQVRTLNANSLGRSPRKPSSIYVRGIGNDDESAVLGEQFLQHVEQQSVIRPERMPRPYLGWRTEQRNTNAP